MERDHERTLPVVAVRFIPIAGGRVIGRGRLAEIGQLRVHGLVHTIDAQIAHALVMRERADLLHARSAGDVVLQMDRFGEMRLAERDVVGPKSVITGTSKAGAKSRGPLSVVTIRAARRTQALLKPIGSG